jgi:hypothetical protein
MFIYMAATETTQTETLTAMINNYASRKPTQKTTEALAGLLNTEMRSSSFDLNTIVDAATTAEAQRWWVDVAQRCHADRGDEQATPQDALATCLAIAQRRLFEFAISASSGPSGGAHRLFDQGIQVEGTARFIQDAQFAL